MREGRSSQVKRPKGEKGPIFCGHSRRWASILKEKALYFRLMGGEFISSSVIVASMTHKMEHAEGGHKRCPMNIPEHFELDVAAVDAVAHRLVELELRQEALVRRHALAPRAHLLQRPLEAPAVLLHEVRQHDARAAALAPANVM